MKAKKEIPSIVTTEFRGVFFGYATDVDGETISRSTMAMDSARLNQLEKKPEFREKSSSETIAKAVDKLIEEYGEALRRLGNE